MSEYRFVHNQPCDVKECKKERTAHVGDIYYACQEHIEYYAELIR